MEIIDIYDDNMDYIGNMERDEAHKKGQWHKVLHCWVINKKNENNEGNLLFQLRSPTKKTHPNKLDVSSAGHLISGESINDSIREVNEELGINVDYENTFYLGYRLSTSNRNQMINREIQLIHFLQTDISLDKFVPQKEEVSGLYWVNIDDCIKLFNKNITTVTGKGKVLNPLNLKWEYNEIDVSIDKLIPKTSNYYLAISIMAKRLFNNEFPLAL